MSCYTGIQYAISDSAGPYGILCKSPVPPHPAPPGSVGNFIVRPRALSANVLYILFIHVRVFIARNTQTRRHDATRRTFAHIICPPRNPYARCVPPDVAEEQRFALTRAPAYSARCVFAVLIVRVHATRETVVRVYRRNAITRGPRFVFYSRLVCDGHRRPAAVVFVPFIKHVGRTLTRRPYDTTAALVHAVIGTARAIVIISPRTAYDFIYAPCGEIAIK